MSESVPQPPLPARVKWPAETIEWWKAWGESEQASDFTATDWNELMDAALLHARLWSGDAKVAGELRARLAKFGSTPVDRARLRKAKVRKAPTLPKGLVQIGTNDDGLPILM